MIFRRPAYTKAFKWGVVGVFTLSANWAFAQDKPQSQVQSDAQISVWVDNAPLKLFVSELATMTGREVVIDGELEGQVSGLFDGSMSETLATVGSRFGLLFDVDETTLGAVSDTERSSASIALNNAQIDDSIKLVLAEDLLPGNTVDWDDSTVMVSGHPAFVKKAARVVTAAVSNASRADLIDSPLVEKATLPVARAESEANAVADVEVTEPILDSAAQVLEEQGADLPSSVQATSDSASTDIEWVSDIPGFNTF